MRKLDGGQIDDLGVVMSALTYNRRHTYWRRGGNRLSSRSSRPVQQVAGAVGGPSVADVVVAGEHQHPSPSRRPRQNSILEACRHPLAPNRGGAKVGIEPGRRKATKPTAH